MSYEQKDNTGVLFPNDRKESDRHPDYTGRMLVNGVEYWVSAWTKQGRSGDFFSLAIKPKEARDERTAQRPAQQPRQPQRGGGRGQLSDDVPFSPCVD